MIVLDTNVVSELLKRDPDHAVLDWMRAADSDELFITAITVAELKTGVELLPDGRRKHEFRNRVAELITTTFSEWVVEFDAQAAGHYAVVFATRFGAGRPVKPLDAQIAAICLQHEATLATRNVRDFDGVGVDLVNPWDG